MTVLRKSARQGASGAAVTAPEKVAEALRHDIIGGRFPPATRLKIGELADRYGTSAMPVREALRQLDGERLVELNAHRGAIVRPVTIGYIQDLYDVREALEGILTERSARAATADDIGALEGLAHAWEAAVATADSDGLLEANARLHGRINAIGRNEEARALTARGAPLLATLRKQIGYRPNRLAEIKDEHRAIVAAIAAHDPGAARQASRDHCFAARDDLVAQLEQVGSLNLSRMSKRG